MEHNDDDHQGGPPVVQAMDHLPCDNLPNDVLEAVVSVAGSRRKVERKKNARERLR